MCVHTVDYKYEQFFQRTPFSFNHPKLLCIRRAQLCNFARPKCCFGALNKVISTQFQLFDSRFSSQLLTSPKVPYPFPNSSAKHRSAKHRHFGRTYGDSEGKGGRYLLICRVTNEMTQTRGFTRSTKHETLGMMPMSKKNTTDSDIAHPGQSP